MVKVSVVIAVYNMEEHLRQCVDSVLKQTLSDIEVICVDDVSTDSSPLILREIASKDSRVRIITQKHNLGAQLARNAGILASNGKFITILDDDDWLASDALELAVKEFDGRSDVNCVILRELRVRSDGSIFEPDDRFRFYVASGEEIYYHSMPWHVSGRYIVRRELQLRILYDNSDRVYGEDNTALLHFLESPRIIQSEGIYYYRLLDTSLSHAMNMAVFEGLLSHIAMSGHLRDMDFGYKIRSAHETFRWLMVVNACFHLYRFSKYYNKEQKQRAKDIIKEDRKSIEWPLVSFKVKLKLGYIPFCNSWKMFWMEEKIYFILKRFLYKV